MRNKNTSCTGNNLPRLVRPAIMGALLIRPMHGYEISKTLEDMGIFGKEGADLSGIYRALNQLQKEGKLVGKLEKSSTAPAKKTYSLTQSGKDCLCCWKSTLNSYKSQIDSVLNLLNKK